MNQLKIMDCLMKIQDVVDFMDENENELKKDIAHYNLMRTSFKMLENVLFSHLIKENRLEYIRRLNERNSEK